MIIAHLVASPFFGGPERQMLGLASALPASYQTAFLGFAEGGLGRPLLDAARKHGFEAVELVQNAPNYCGVVREVSEHLHRLNVNVLCCHGYKPDILGQIAARRVGVPVVAVSRGWTGTSTKVRLNEALDRYILRRMDRVVCVSEGQATKVCKAGVSPDLVVVIRNAIRADRFSHPDPTARDELLAMFPEPPRRIVGAAGRLSPEKGFGMLVEAARQVARVDPTAGFVLFGDGPLREELANRIAAYGLESRFLLAGFLDHLDRFIPHLDVFALSSYSEGLPNVVLEASAAGVPIVATSVGGTPEVVEDGVTGHLVPPGDSKALAGRIVDLLGDESTRLNMGSRGRCRIREIFTFESQAYHYDMLLSSL